MKSKIHFLINIITFVSIVYLLFQWSVPNWQFLLVMLFWTFGHLLTWKIGNIVEKKNKYTIHKRV